HEPRILTQSHRAAVGQRELHPAAGAGPKLLVAMHLDAVRQRAAASLEPAAEGRMALFHVADDRFFRLRRAARREASQRQQAHSCVFPGATMFGVTRHRAPLEPFIWYIKTRTDHTRASTHVFPPRVGRS